jgi:hypothetical protein
MGAALVIYLSTHLAARCLNAAHFIILLSIAPDNFIGELMLN